MPVPRSLLPAGQVPEPAQALVNGDPLCEIFTQGLRAEAGRGGQFIAVARRRRGVGQHAGDIHERIAELCVLPVEQPQARTVQQIALRQVTMRDAGAKGLPIQSGAAALELRQRCGRGRHGDLAQNNLLEGQQLWLLDWEYAQLSDPLMDLACVLAYYPAAMRHRAEFAAAAGLSAQAAGEALAQRITIYQALSWLWHLARGEPASWDWHPDVPAGKLAGP